MTLVLPSLLCSACGTVAIPCVAPGTGPHVAKAVCTGCGRFLKWLPKPTEVRMHGSINHCILLGAISPRGVEVSYHGGGTAKAAFMLVVSELGSDGKAHQLW